MIRVPGEEACYHIYHTVVRSIWLYGYKTWPVRLADERVLEVFDNDSIHRILRIRRRDCVPSVELRRPLCPLGMPTQLG